MKRFFENNTDSFNKTYVMINCTVVFAVTLIICSLLSFYLAEFLGYYYDMRLLSIELIAVLRSSITILTAGTVIMAYIERQEKRND